MKKDYSAYRKYIQGKNLPELIELLDQIDPRKLRTEHEIITERIESLKAENPTAYEEVRIDKKYDTIGRRLIANFVDTVPVYICIYLAKTYLAEPLSLAGDQPIILVELVIFSIYTLMLIANGQTLGMKIAEIKLLSITEAKASWMHVIANQVSGLIVLAVAYFVAAALWDVDALAERIVLFGTAVLNLIVMSSNKKRQAISDFCSKTVVVATKYIT